MLRFVFSILGGIFSLATLGAVGGALIVGAVFYMYGRDLPNHEQLSQYTPPTISRIYSTEGRIIDEFSQERRLFTPIEEVPDLVKAAFISAEDKNFYEHGGFDARGIAAAVIEAVETRGARVRGASTIPQQVVKNFLLSSDRSAERKIKELILSVRLESTLSKDKILELYLNEIFLGQNSYGVTAAAQTYFNKPLSDLTPAEAAYLGALPQRPSSLHPVRNEADAIQRRNFVLREMNENGYIDDATYQEARLEPLLTVQAGDLEGFRQQLPPRDYFTDEIRRQLTRDFGEGQFLGGGLTVRATIDPEMQIEAASALRRQLEAYDREQGEWRGTGLTLPTDILGDEKAWREALAALEIPRDIEGWFPAVVLAEGDTSVRIGIEGVRDDADGHFIPREDVRWIRGASTPGDILDVGDVVHVRAMTSDSDGSFLRWTLRQVPEVQGGFMAMDVNTGRVIAIQGGFSYQHSVFNRATQATRQPGSSFKPFVYAAALDSGFTPATIIVDAPIEVDVGGGRVWRPRNASNEFYGPTPLRTGIERSRNLMTVRLAEEIGMDVVASYAELFGVYDRMGQYLANALGSEETTLYRMVAAYAMFANGGERIEPTLVDRVQDRWGTTIYRHDARNCEECGTADLDPGRAPRIISNRRQVMDPVTAYQLTSMMQGVVQRGTAAGRVNLPVPAAGKTGTTNDAKDVWFVGFTSNIAAGCYIGYDTPRPLGRGASGGRFCAPVFQDFMEKAVAKYGGGPFEVPPGGRFIKIDRFTGERLPDTATGDYVVAEYFRDGEEPVFGLMYDGGFAMGSNLPLFERDAQPETETTVTAGDGQTVTIPTTRDTGTISSGGLY
ncbi:penicillin-binding protein 1A [Ovoidimarina sediminis]|uniref:penicillin-binding protein 1A n=1 Tax=Ovoidimarina sediminis TaxID=3079856 RepID=UPI0029132FF3|nr:PBP1A family penicillin-binding protein [Rhodophyticola sp. MJ-SS7]MDU8945052.1 PBP1A family penicillin-binding protein [Rhodophyticola sp. MJ-SS7]